MNNHVNKTKRKNAAACYIGMLYEGKTVINIDESIISSTDERKYSWQQSGVNCIVTSSQRLSLVSVIFACSSKGDLYFTVNRGKNN